MKPVTPLGQEILDICKDLDSLAQKVPQSVNQGEADHYSRRAKELKRRIKELEGMIDSRI
ncbi:hypothetical protein ACFST9_22050 [Hymenobacter monticola]|uniref:Uncharacterized protein n=1 Tax=Hymenobacter monticola TaxID=1705399 RepID=A0ABY4B5C3_9BACT|nr:hypothetical protein [Hymenobacter monticola]UOE34215.1 hypothetical protein MTP16_00855 [Hymenobacter monticola]